MPRSYRLGRRQASVDRTVSAIVEAGRQLVGQDGLTPSVGAVARRAGVSRLTVYSHFGSKDALMAALAPPPRDHDSHDLRDHFERSSAAWAESPTLFRKLHVDQPGDSARRIAEQLAATDGLRPGCSIKEAEDVIAALSSFAVFDRLYKDGRRPLGAVTDILLRLAGGILA